MKKVLISSFILILSLMILISSIGVSADWDTSQIVVPETAAKLNGGWGAGASNPTYSSNQKLFTLNAKATASGYTQQFQCLIYISNFSTVLSGAKKVAFDFYPSFTNQNGADSCYMKYSFDDSTWSSDFDNPLKSNEKYTLILDSSSIASTAKFIHLQFQNYGNQVSSDAVIMGTAPYIYEAGTPDNTTSSQSSTDSTSSTQGSTNPTQAGEGFDPSTITFPETVVSMTKGWEADCSLIVAVNKKYATFTSNTTSSGYRQQFQGYINYTNFSNLFNSTSQIAIDFYPTFGNKENWDKNCYLKYSFDQQTYSGEYSNALKSGEKYTLVIDSSDIPTSANAIHMVFQNYGSALSDDAQIIVSAPYAYGEVVTSPSTEPSTQSQSNPTNTTSEPPTLNTSKAYFKINNVKVSGGDLTEVPITIGNNPGIFIAKLNIAYDNTLLTFKEIKAGDVFGSDEIYYGTTIPGKINIAFESSDLMNNNSKNGTVAKLVFQINKNADTTTTLLNFTDYSENDYINCTAETVPFTFGNGIVSITKKVPTLAAPSGVKVTLNNNKKATITWKASADAKGYEVFRKVNSGAWKSYKTVLGGSVKFVDGSLKAGKKYTYKVRAFSSTLVSAFSSNSKTVVTYKLAQVKSLKAKVKGKKVTLSWKKVTIAQKYEIFVSTKKSSGFKKVKTLKSKKATLKLKAKKKYYIKVRALRTVGTAKQKVYSKYSAVKTAKAK